MEIDVRNQSLQSSMDYLVEEARQDENLAATTVCCEYIINLKGQVTNLTRQLGELREEVIQSSKWASVAESKKDEALAQSSSLKETHCQRDESLAHAIVLQQEFNKQADDLKGMTLAVEKSHL